MFLIIAFVLIVVAYFSIPAYVLSSVVLYVLFQIMGLGRRQSGWVRQIRDGGFIGWLISLPVCLVVVYFQRPV
jgi:hypothetical protein